LASITVDAVNKIYTIPTGNGFLPREYFYHSLILRYSGRFHNPATNGPTGVYADGAKAIIELVKVSGFHNPRKQQEDFFRMRGAELYELDRDFSGSAPHLLPAGALNVTASADNDVSILVQVPFVVSGMRWPDQLKTLLDAPNYDQLKLEITIGDMKSLFSGQTVDPTITTYGSANGSPKIDVYALYALGGAEKFAGFVPARPWRYFSEITSGDIVAGSANEPELFNLPRGYWHRAMLLKTGTKAAAGSNNAYATLSDVILSTLKLNFGQGRAIKYYRDFVVAQEATRRAYGLRPSTGYVMLDFAPNANIGEMLDTTRMTAGPTSDISLTLTANVAAGASQAALLQFEEVRGRAMYQGQLL